MTVADGSRLGAARVAVTALFVVNGAAVPSLLTRLAELKAAAGLTDGALGGALFAAGLAALAGSLAAGPLIARLGSRRTTLAAGALLAASLPLSAVVPRAAGVVAGFAAWAALDVVMDIAMNAQAVEVERSYGRSLMNSFHAAWSAGALGGAAVATAAAAGSIPLVGHLAAVGAALLLILSVSARRLLPTDRQPVQRTSRPRPAGAVLGLGSVLLFAAFIEDSQGSWSAVYLAESLGVPIGFAGLGNVAFLAAMLGGRLGGDRVVARWGAVTTVRCGGLVALAGMVMVLTAPQPTIAVVGYGAVGLGVCTVFPVVFSAAGNLPGVSPGAAIAVVTLFARVELLAGPPLVGLMAGATSLRLALWIVAGAAALMAMNAGRLSGGAPTTPRRR